MTALEYKLQQAQTKVDCAVDALENTPVDDAGALDDVQAAYALAKYELYQLQDEAEIEEAQKAREYLNKLGA